MVVAAKSPVGLNDPLASMFGTFPMHGMVVPPQKEKPSGFTRPRGCFGLAPEINYRANL